MSDRRKMLGSTFLATAVLGALFIITELIFQSLGKSICPTDGCGIVSQNSRYGDVPILLLGLVTFAALAVLSFLVLHRNRVSYERYINLILVVSLAAEGFFVGYQAFRINAICVICMITFSFFAVLGIIRLLYGEKAVVAGFLSCAAVFALFYLILPAGGTVKLPEEELVLFYSQECKYCKEVMEKIKANNITVSHLLIGQYAGLLKNIGIEHVPTLLVNKKNQKLFLTGRDAIDQYLFTPPQEQPQKESPLRMPAKTKNVPLPKAGTRPSVPDLFLLPRANPSPLIIQSGDNGMCKEGVKEVEKCE